MNAGDDHHAEQAQDGDRLRDREWGVDEDLFAPEYDVRRRERATGGRHPEGGERREHAEIDVRRDAAQLRRDLEGGDGEDCGPHAAAGARCPATALK
jgi:hypothetical protein